MFFSLEKSMSSSEAFRLDRLSIPPLFLLSNIFLQILLLLSNDIVYDDWRLVLLLIKKQNAINYNTVFSHGSCHTRLTKWLVIEECCHSDYQTTSASCATIYLFYGLPASVYLFSRYTKVSKIFHILYFMCNTDV